MNSSFHDQLVATRDRKHSKNHPFFELWAQGKLTREQTAFYRTQHYHFVGEFLNWLAYQGFRLLSALMHWHPFVRHDGPLSIARAFRREDWERLLTAAGLEGTARVRWRFPFRYCVERTKW